MASSGYRKPHNNPATRYLKTAADCPTGQGPPHPGPASSGNTSRYRLSRGGDRRLNRALASIALTRRSHHQPTQDYVGRRRAEGRTTKEIRRCVKRYIARQIYRSLNAQPAT